MTGFGVEYQNKIVDPMFDSELFTIFDLYIHFKDKYEISSNNAYDFFISLLRTLKSGRNQRKYSLIDAITSYLPCDVFVCEEHLKNWVVKKFFAESILLDSWYQTKKYFFIGMGLLDGTVMSSSNNHAILSKDLIEQYGGKTARLIILLNGGNVSKSCKYDQDIPLFAAKLIRNLTSYLNYLISKNKQDLSNNSNRSATKLKESLVIEKHITSGYYRQAIIELFIKIPKKNHDHDQSKIGTLLSLYKKYLNIFLPGFFDNLGKKS